MRISKYEEKIKDDNDVSDIISKIAKDELFIDTLETRMRDCLDFYDVSVRGVKKALLKAFILGFGEICFVDEDGKIKIYSEAMSKDFVRQALIHILDNGEIVK